MVRLAAPMHVQPLLLLTVVPAVALMATEPLAEVCVYWYEVTKQVMAALPLAAAHVAMERLSALFFPQKPPRLAAKVAFRKHLAPVTSSEG